MPNTWWHLLAAPLRQVEDALVRGMCDIIGVTSLITVIVMIKK